MTVQDTPERIISFLVRFISFAWIKPPMSDTTMEHMHADMEQLKNDISIIKHILTEEGKLTPYARKALAEARATPDSEYINHNELKKRILK